MYQFHVAYAEESSILENASVYDGLLWNADIWYPAYDLIGRAFKNQVNFISHNPDYGNAAEF